MSTPIAFFEQTKVYNGRAKIHDILYHFDCPIHDDWRKGIPRFWRKYREELNTEISRIIDRKPGKVNVTLGYDGSISIEESIRLIAHLAAGYSAVLVDFKDSTQ